MVLRGICFLYIQYIYLMHCIIRDIINCHCWLGSTRLTLSKAGSYQDQGSQSCWIILIGSNSQDKILEYVRANYISYYCSCHQPCLRNFNSMFSTFGPFLLTKTKRLGFGKLIGSWVACGSVKHFSKSTLDWCAKVFLTQKKINKE